MYIYSPLSRKLKPFLSNELVFINTHKTNNMCTINRVRMYKCLLHEAVIITCSKVPFLDQLYSGQLPGAQSQAKSLLFVQRDSGVLSIFFLSD